MDINKAHILYSFIMDNLEELEEDGSGGTSFDIPSFDLHARDYLEFAENQLSIGNTESLINCISNLKRAIDCQVDTFLATLNLYSNYKKKGLKFDKKLEFIESIGIFSSKALSKLNTIRNKMEHEYSIPEINELDLYFDLVSAFISNIESAITVLIWDEKNFVKNSENETEYIYFTINLDRKTSPYMIASWRNRKWDTIEEIKISYEDYKLFGFFLKCLYMLNIKNAFASNKYIKLQLTKSYNKLIER